MKTYQLNSVNICDPDNIDLDYSNSPIQPQETYIEDTKTLSVNCEKDELTFRNDELKEIKELIDEENK